MLDIMLQRMRAEGRVEVRQTVESLRKERGYMVQSLVCDDYTISHSRNHTMQTSLILMCVFQLY